MQELKSVYDSLPADEKKNCLIWGKHYSQVGAVELFRNHYGLPHAFSYHGSFYSWAQVGKMPETVIAYCYNDAGDNFFNPSDSCKKNLQQLCEQGRFGDANHLYMQKAKAEF